MKAVLLYSNISTGRAVSKLRLDEICIETGDKAAIPAHITAGYRANGVYLTTPRLFRTQLSLPVS